MGHTMVSATLDSSVILQIWRNRAEMKYRNFAHLQKLVVSKWSQIL